MILHSGETLEEAHRRFNIEIRKAFDLEQMDQNVKDTARNYELVCDMGCDDDREGLLP